MISWLVLSATRLGITCFNLSKNEMDNYSICVIGIK